MFNTYPVNCLSYTILDENRNPYNGETFYILGDTVYVNKSKLSKDTIVKVNVQGLTPFGESKVQLIVLDYKHTNFILQQRKQELQDITKELEQKQTNLLLIAKDKSSIEYIQLELEIM